MNILFYTPFSGRSRDTESLMLSFQEQGHKVFYLSQQYGQEIQNILTENGISVYNTPNRNSGSILSILKEVLFLVKFCKRKKINLLFSHLEPCNIVAVLSQYLITSKVIICRHHVDEMLLTGKDKLLSYKLTYKLGKQFIVVSQKAKDFMAEHEKVSADRIDVINLSYNFDLYDKPTSEKVVSIRKEFNCELLLITACRMIIDKRPDMSIKVLEELIKNNIDAKLLLLGDGAMMEDLKKYINKKGLNRSCFLMGRKNNILDFLSAADILLHPSIIDSSSVIVKEAGLAKKTAIVCKEVGDFASYIENENNGILVSKDNFISEATTYIINSYKERNKWSEMGAQLNSTILKLFEIKNNFHFYKKYIQSDNNSIFYL